MTIHNEQLRENPAVQISDIIRDFIRHAPESSLKNETGEMANLALARHVANTLQEAGVGLIFNTFRGISLREPA